MGGRFYLAATLIAASIAAPAPAGAQTADGGKPLFDSRNGPPARPAAPEAAAAIRARERLSARLGRQGVVDIDERTGTPRFVGRLDGYLTGPSGADPQQVVLDYVRAQRSVFGLSDGDLAALRLTRRYSDASGTTYLSWAQTWRGLAAFDNGLDAAVAADGRLINVAGSPLPDLGARSSQPGIGPGAALAQALDDAGTRGLAPRATQQGGAERHTTFSGGHDARLVLFADRRGDVRLAWRVTANAGAGEVYDDVVDADSGELLFRHNTVDFFVNGQVHAYPNHPGVGTNDLRTVPVTDGSALSGPNAHVYPDANADDAPDSEIAATSGTTWADSCGPCTWDPATPNSWQANLRANGAQAYYFVNEFHDWLKNEPNIAFTAGTFDGNDPLQVEVLDGAATNAGVPNSQHLNNANMETPADGTSPRMQLYLFDITNPAVNGGDDAGVVFHEYTHGLSHRLTHGLDSLQSDAMGEGWSDWYALDYLVQHGLEADGPAANDLQLATYLFPDGLRSQGIDCRPANAADCPGIGSAGAGGYTYGDFGRVAPATAEHANGEIWGQTLWDLRAAVGAADARRLITGGMRVSVANPSMLEMRNAIIQADTVAFAGAHRDTLWQVFAARGMGFSAASFGGDDRKPVESFAPAPAPGSGGTVSGRVTDTATGAPVAGALVELASTASGFPGDISAVTDSRGAYSIADVPPAAYPRTSVNAPAYTPAVEPAVQVPAGGRTLDLTLSRDYAASSGGARITGFDGPDFTSGALSCGPPHLIDLSYLSGWGSTSPNGTHGPGGAKSVTIELPQTVDVSAFNVDPGAVCGDDDTASTRDYRIETSRDGATFTQAAAGRFNSGNNHRANVIVAPAGTDGVRYVRYTMLTPQRQTGSDAGVDWMDTTEFEVYGVPEGFGRAAPPPPPPDSGGGSLTAVDRVAPTLGLALVAGQRLKAALARGMKVRVSCDEGCLVAARALLDARTAKRLKLLSRRSRAKSVTVAAGLLPLGGGARTATLRFTPAARKRLAGLRSVRLSIAAMATDASGNDRKRTVTVTVRR